MPNIGAADVTAPFPQPRQLLFRAFASQDPKPPFPRVLANQVRSQYLHRRALVPAPSVLYLWAFALRNCLEITPQTLLIFFNCQSVLCCVARVPTSPYPQQRQSHPSLVPPDSVRSISLAVHMTLAAAVVRGWRPKYVASASVLVLVKGRGGRMLRRCSCAVLYTVAFQATSSACLLSPSKCAEGHSGTAHGDTTHHSARGDKNSHKWMAGLCKDTTYLVV